MNYKTLTLPYKEEMIKNIKAFCAIDSTFDPSSIDKTNPFGKGVSKALNFIYELAKKDGFEVHNYDNMLVEILVGKGEKNITILAHADVVPAGEGWDQDPFVVKDDGKELYGRGVADDKGPCLSCYYALKALKDNNLLGDYQVRFLVGGNEETGSKGVYHYFHELNKKAPTLGFSPDSSFPIIYAEKGIFGFKIRKKLDIPGLISLKGGEAGNAVISHCRVRFAKSETMLNFVKHNYRNTEITLGKDYDDYLFIGKAAHGSIPWEGVNAGMHALNIITGTTMNKDLITLMHKLSDTRGVGLNADAISPKMDNVTNSLNVGLMSYENGVLEITVNFRFGNACNFEDLKKKIAKELEGFEVTFTECSPLLYYPKDSVLIKTLMKVYQEETGDLVNKEIATGGGTYAKETENVVAYGLEFPGFDALMHSPGEHIKIEHLTLGMAIYSKAIVELGKKL